MKRIIRKELRTAEEAEKDNQIRKKIEAELPDLIARHHKRMEKRKLEERKQL